MSEVVDTFDKCKQFFLNNKAPVFTPEDVSLKYICQCLWDNKGQPIYLYATLYSTSLKIPVFSAYVYNRNKTIGRCDAWYIEPQLDVPSTTDQCMKSKGNNKHIGTNQALNSDYEKSGYDRGHLYPVLHTNNHLSMLATSTLTNAAPQDSDFNRNTWLKHEEAVINDLYSCDKEAYVVTGVVPDMDAPKLNNRVYVSKYYWRATCCQKGTQYTGMGYYGPDKKNEVKTLTIEDLNTKLQEFYRGPTPISIFNCQKPERKRARE
ncbi:endonuclease domain-containing 1 protein-like [Carassius carassius]|uniref:endonuclease domain-containing 1 protein-like n=1 Tax=Carassius carassius TaxID=217509 RepID=UPI002868D78E|nr:endonuclease domain-containing 1 protein-like [Carassius carassius]